MMNQSSDSHYDVAVVGAGHVPGMTRILNSVTEPPKLEPLEIIPKKPIISKMIPWLIPAVVVALFVGGFFFGDPAKFKEAAWAWVL